MHRPNTAMLLFASTLAAQSPSAASPAYPPQFRGAELPPLLDVAETPAQSAAGKPASSQQPAPAQKDASAPGAAQAAQGLPAQPERFLETRTIQPDKGVTFIDGPTSGQTQAESSGAIPNTGQRLPPLSSAPDEVLVDPEMPEPLPAQVLQAPPPPPQPTTPMWQPDDGAVTKSAPATTPARPASPVATSARPRVARTPTPEYVLQGIQLYLIGDFDTALPILRDNAENGDPRSRHLYGLALFNGQGTPPDRPAGLAWTRLAAANGSDAASQSLKAMQEARNPSEIAASQAAYAFITRPRPISAANSAPKAATPVRMTAAPVKSAPVEPTPPRAATLEPRQAPLKTTPPKPAPASSLAPISETGNWTLQLGAFAVPGNAATLRTRLAKRPEISGYSLTVTTGARLTSVRASGYSASAARAACASLQAAGFVCVPTGG